MCELDIGPNMYQLELRTSNLSAAYLENTGKMVANEGGAATYKLNTRLDLWRIMG